MSGRAIDVISLADRPQPVSSVESLGFPTGTGALVGPLHGIPVAVKGQVETKGIETRFGCVALSGYVPEKDATIVAKMKEAGAIILGKTAMPDFATSWFGYSSVNGEPKNPYDLDRDPDGSSAGTGAAIAGISQRLELEKTLAARSGCRPASTASSTSA